MWVSLYVSSFFALSALKIWSVIGLYLLDYNLSWSFSKQGYLLWNLWILESNYMYFSILGKSCLKFLCLIILHLVPFPQVVLMQLLLWPSIEVLILPKVFQFCHLWLYFPIFLSYILVFHYMCYRRFEVFEHPHHDTYIEILLSERLQRLLVLCYYLMHRSWWTFTCFRYCYAVLWIWIL